MQELDDISLLREFTERNAEQAFAALVERHINKVYSVALRHTRNPNSAEEITHVVFVILAQKAKQLRKGVILEGWLYETARLTALTCIRGEIRRARREQEAYMQTVSNENESEAWAQIAPNLDAALAGLNATDRTAVVLRFFYGKSMSEIGATLGGTEESARKRVSRAIEKLRGYFSKRGITSTAATMTAALSVNAVQAAPAALIKTTTALALANGATASTSTSTLTKGVLKIMAWSKTKTSVIAAIAMLLAVGSPVVLKYLAAHRQAAAKAAFQQRFPSVPGSVLDNPMNRVLRKSPHREEVLKLRAQVWPEETRAKINEINARQVNETTDAATIDLKPYVNTKLEEGPMGDKGDNSDNLAQLPTGTHNFAGVPFDVEGAVYLTGGWLKQFKKDADYPAAVKGIRIDRRCGKIHILHGAGLISFGMAGSTIARLNLNYSDGSKAELPIVCGVNVWDWWAPLFKTGVNSLNLKTDSSTEPAWTGTNPMIKRMQPDEYLVLYRTTFTNPHPNRTLSTIDYVSDKTISVPFMVGLTVE